MKIKLLTIFVSLIILCLSAFISASCKSSEQPDPVLEEQAEVSVVEEEEEDKAEDSAKPGTSTSGEIVVDGEIEDGEYANHMFNGGTQMDLYFTIDDTYLYMGIMSRVYKWAAIGFGPEFAMQGADIILMKIENGDVIMRDDFGVEAYRHAPDESLGGSFDIIEYKGSENGNKLIFEFIKPLDSGDEFDKVLEPGTLYRIILSANESSSDFDSKHTIRFMSQLQF